MIRGIFDIVILVAYFALTIPALYFLIVAIAGRLRRPSVYPNASEPARIAVLIPAYREDTVIIDTCRAITSHDYPRANFTVYVAAHELQAETIATLATLPLQLITINSEFGSKALSLQTLLNSIDEKEFDLALVLDADNIIAAGGLYAISNAFQIGYQGIQLHRTAKNEDSRIAYLEGVSEEINNNLFRNGPRSLGLSASTIGSGMAFPIKKLKEIYNLPGITFNPACDRVIDFELMRDGITIEYLNDVFVFDEKVNSLAVFKRQRLRWIESQIMHIKMFLNNRASLDFSSVNIWNKLLSNVFPPRIILLGLLVIINILYLFPASGSLEPARSWWQGSLFIYLIALIISIPGNKFNIRLLQAVIYAPLTFVIIFFSFFKARPHRKEFIHTPKAYKKSREG